MYTILLLLIVSQAVFSNDDYRNGNGTVISRTSTDDKIIEIRKLEIENVNTGDMLSGRNTIYDDYNNKNKIGEVNWYNELVNIDEICTIEYIGKTNGRGRKQGELWIKISTKIITGWLCYYSDCYQNLYENDNYEFLENIKTVSRIWTVRKLEQWVSVWTNLNVRDKPGLDGNKMYLIKYDGAQLNYKTVAITEETETIDGKNDRWVKIEYARGKYGWCFGGYVGVARGGPKYEIPEDEIMFLLGNEP